MSYSTTNPTSNLSPSDVHRYSGGTISVNQASQWLNAWHKGRTLSKPVQIMLSYMVRHKQSGSTDFEVDLTESHIVKNSVPCADVFRSGVYFLVKGSKIIYVGQSLQPAVRLKNHICEKDFDKVFFMETPENLLLEVERYYIGKFKPELNRDKNPNHYKGTTLPPEVSANAFPCTEGVKIGHGAFIRRGGQVYFKIHTQLYKGADFGAGTYHLDYKGRLQSLEITNDVFGQVPRIDW